MSITKGAMLISNANAVGTELVNQLGGTGYKPVEWSDKINLLGINSVDAPYAIKSIQAGTYTGEERGAIQYSNCNAVGSMLNKKLNTNRGFKPVEWPSAIKVLKALTENTVSGDICNVSDGADRVPLKSWNVNIPPTLTGKSTVVCTDAGKNIKQYVTDYSAGNPVFFQYRNYYAGQATGYPKLEGTFKPGTYTLSFDTTASITASKVGVWAKKKSDQNWYNLSANGDLVAPTSSGYSFCSVSSGHVTGTFKINEECDALGFGYYQYGTSIPYTNLMLEIGSTATTYTQYVAPTVNTVDLGRTIYGGTAGIVNGEGQELCGKIVFDGSETRWSAYTAGNGYAIPLTGMKRGTWYTSDLALSYPLPKVPNNDNLGVRIGVNNDGIYVVQANTIEGVTDLASFKAWLAENHLTIIYPLDIDIDFTFTPITPTPETALGVNNFWNDTGSNTITYYQAPTALTRSTVSGSIASFSDADTRLTCVNAIATIPPSIAGVDTVQLVDAGKNLFDVGTQRSDYNRGQVINVSDGVVSFEIYSSGNTFAYRNFNIDAFGEFSISAITSKKGGRILVHIRNKANTAWLSNSDITITGWNYNAVFGGWYKESSTTEVSQTINIPNENASFWQLGLGFANTYVTVGDTETFEDIMVEVGSTATTYTPYVAPTTYTANLPSTNYGGSVDFVNGVDTEDYARVKISDLSWIKQTESNRDFFIATSSIMSSGTSKTILCDVLPYGGEITVSAMDNKSLASWGVTLRIYDTDITNVTELLNTYGSGKIIYPLATPTTASITGQAIIPKTGTNNCYNNVGGNTEITYFTNT